MVVIGKCLSWMKMLDVLTILTILTQKSSFLADLLQVPDIMTTPFSVRSANLIPILISFYSFIFSSRQQSTFLDRKSQMMVTHCLSLKG